MRRWWAAGVVAAWAVAIPAAQPLAVDPGLPAYRKVSGVSGSLNSLGSDTMNNLMSSWGEAFRRYYPSVRLQVEGKGSSTAPPALIAGTAQFGPMSRAMRASEIDQFEARYGYGPTEVKVAYDALAVFVHRDNPLAQLSLAQLDAIFGKMRRRGHGPVRTWGDLGLTGDWARRPISLYGRNSASGTYGFFKERVLRNGDFKDNVKEQPGSGSVVQSITEDRYAIGYSGIGYRTSGVRIVPLSRRDGEPASAGRYEDVASGAYPLSRFLLIYLNKPPDRPLPPLALEFMRLVFSAQGQQVVAKDGYLPLAAPLAQEQLAHLAATAPPERAR